MKKHNVMQYLLITSLLIIFTWTVLTLWVEQQGPSKFWMLGNSTGKKAIIIYDPDPFYDLDEKICLSIGKALAKKDINTHIFTVAAARKYESKSYDLYLYCANTYNWRPDWSIRNYIKEHASIPDKPSVAITIGAGATAASKKNLEKLITSCGGKILSSHSLWLLRPNDDSKTEASNVKIAVNQAYQWGEQIADEINKTNSLTTIKQHTIRPSEDN